MPDNETIADIAAEKRRIAKEIRDHARRANETAEDLEEEADRLEAAHKRERGNAAKLREACANIAEYARAAMCHTTDTHVLGYLNQIEGWAKAALAEPFRNCDVGKAQEQDERFHRFCVKHHTGSCAGCHNPVGDYTVANGVRECALVWAQMPYEEGGAK